MLWLYWRLDYPNLFQEDLHKKPDSLFNGVVHVATVEETGSQERSWLKLQATQSIR